MLWKYVDYGVQAEETLIHELGHAFVMLHKGKLALKEIIIYPEKDYSGQCVTLGHIESLPPAITLLHAMAGEIAAGYILEDRKNHNHYYHRKILYKELLTGKPDVSDEYAKKMMELMLNDAIVESMHDEIIEILDLYREDIEKERKSKRYKRRFSIEHLKKREGKALNIA